MVRLSAESERLDALNVLAADRRELTLGIRTVQPLRKSRNRKQKKVIDRLRDQARTQIDQQLSDRARRAFRGRVAVEVRASVSPGRGVPDLPTMVKEYMDQLVITVVQDDSVVDHLIAVLEPTTESGADVTIRCLPLDIFAAEFDRAFRTLTSGAVISTVTPDGASSPTAPFLDAAPNPRWRWGLNRFDEMEQSILRRDESLLDLLLSANDREDEALEEDEDGFVDLDLPSGYDEFEDRGTRDSTIDHLVASIAARRATWLVDQGFDARDRPGPLPTWIAETIERDEADVMELPDDGPGCFVLSAPPAHATGSSASAWNAAATQKFASVVGYGPWRDACFQGDIAVDIALRGEAGKTSDIDNLARRILTALTKSFRADAQARIGAYRVYRKAWHDDDVRVRLMPKIRLEALAGSMDLARQEARSGRSERTRR